MSDKLIKKWISTNRPLLECEKRERRDFEKYIKGVEKEMKTEKGSDYPDDKDSTDKLFIHEFLFLLCNGKGRNDTITKLTKPKFTTDRESIKQYEM